MIRGLATLVILSAALVGGAAPAAAEDKPVVGQPWPWPVLRGWLEGSPSGSDAAGKVVVHWLCKPKSEECKTDLARVYNMREQGNVYVIAYINGSKRDATRLDPVRGEVGAGAVAFGKPVATLFKQLGVSAAMLPMSVVVDVDGKVAAITYTGDPDQLDIRDKKVASLVEAIRIFTVKTSAPPGQVKKGVTFELGLSAELAPWLEFERSSPEIKLMLPPDVTCDTAVLRGDQIKLEGRRLKASVSCKGAVKGSYEVAGALRFRYRGPNRALGLGEDMVRWKFAIAP